MNLPVPTVSAARVGGSSLRPLPGRRLYPRGRRPTPALRRGYARARHLVDDPSSAVRGVIAIS